MLWVALATVIMLLSGELSRESDDAETLTLLLAAFRESTTETVAEAPRRVQALAALSGFEQAFAAYREQLEVFKVCIAAADGKYDATRADYDACVGPLETERASVHTSLVNAQAAYEAAVTQAEGARIAEAVMALPEARLLDPVRATEATGSGPSRSRGLQGVVTERHPTLPRNVVAIVFGPLSPAMFGQRYPSRIIDGGTSYAHQDPARADATGTPPELWNMRAGVRVGLFDDFEVGAFFIPLQLAPKFHFDPVLLCFTQQFRFSGFDLAFRAAFQTPDKSSGWSIAPGTFLAWPGRRLAARAGLILPMEVGTVRDPVTPTIGLNAPLRVTWNLVPSFSLSGESGVAYDDLRAKGELEVPLGFGAGYSLLVGAEVVDFTASFTWDHWLLPAPEDAAARLDWDAFRVAFGVSLYFQAL